MQNNFIDRAKIFIQSGKGGDGCMSFRREKFVEFGGPDGGNGGKGGSIIFKATSNLNTLTNFHYKKHYKAKQGEKGKSRLCFGKNSEDLIILVPVGTIIYDDQDSHIIAEFEEDGEEKIILKGGEGGIGNAFFKTSTNRAPRKFTPGFSGFEKWVRLELKLFANVGLLGKPNVGKSSFISKTTNYNAKIANYAFTTLKPSLGVVHIDEKNIDKSFVIADLPGLIYGASNGKGLGLDFLRHVEKCEILMHIIDVSNKSIDQIISDYNMIWNELSKYDKILRKKKEVIVFNKIDLCNNISELKKLKDSLMQTLENKDIFLISTFTSEGIKNLNYRLFELVNDLKMKNNNKSKKPYFPDSGYKKNIL
jgi:GTP-binding protein